MTIDRETLIGQATKRAKQAIKRHGVTAFADAGVKIMEHNGVTVVWKNDYNDGVFKIILRNHLSYPPLHLVRVRWVNNKTITDYDREHLIDGLQVAMKRLDQLMVLDDLARIPEGDLR
jgi:hypothetical protein